MDGPTGVPAAVGGSGRGIVAPAFRSFPRRSRSRRSGRPSRGTSMTSPTAGSIRTGARSGSSRRRSRTTPAPDCDRRQQRHRRAGVAAAGLGVRPATVSWCRRSPSSPPRLRRRWPGATAFVDIDPETYAMDPAAAAAAVPTDPVRDAGASVPHDGRHGGRHRVARRHGLTVVEDSAEAIGMRRDGVHAGLHGAGGRPVLLPHQDAGRARRRRHDPDRRPGGRGAGRRAAPPRPARQDHRPHRRHLQPVRRLRHQQQDGRPAGRRPDGEAVPAGRRNRPPGRARRRVRRTAAGPAGRAPGADRGRRAGPRPTRSGTSTWSRPSAGTHWSST